MIQLLFVNIIVCVSEEQNKLGRRLPEDIYNCPESDEDLKICHRHHSWHDGMRQ